MIFLSVFLANFLALTSSTATKGSTIASWLQSTLDFRIDGDLSEGSYLIAIYSGQATNSPLSTPLIDTTGKPAFHSTTQQALYGVHRQ